MHIDIAARIGVFCASFQAPPLTVDLPEVLVCDAEGKENGRRQYRQAFA
jgi:hypothetical protein